MSDLRIRTMRSDEIAIAADWAAAEGWNPGLNDAATVDYPAKRGSVCDRGYGRHHSISGAALGFSARLDRLTGTSRCRAGL
jgi:hypothetical protein